MLFEILYFSTANLDFTRSSSFKTLSLMPFYRQIGEVSFYS